MDANIFNEDEFNPEDAMRAAWNAVCIERPVQYSLFTFGESTLPYFLISRAEKPTEPVSITKGQIKITRPTIITPNNAQPEFQNFFDDADEENFVQFIMSRTAAFSHLKFDNSSGPARIVSDSVEEVVDKLNRQLDDEEEDHIAILSAPKQLTGLALFKYATERILSSTPDNLQELRERGFLP